MDRRTRAPDHHPIIALARPLNIGTSLHVKTALFEVSARGLVPTAATVAIVFLMLTFW